MADVVAAHINRVASVIKVFRGDISGEFVFDGVVTGNAASVRNIECRLPIEAVHLLVPILRMDYTVTLDNTPSSDLPGKHRYIVWIPARPCFIPLHLHIYALSRRAWRPCKTAFDIDLLAVDTDHVYLRHIPLVMRGVNDRIAILISRVRQRKFALLESGAGAMRRAIQMVASGGWYMDDTIRGPAGWVVGRWENMLRNPSTIRRSVVVRDPLSKYDVCALCQEAFAYDDVVVNLACNHNFHGNCTSSSGLCNWLDRNDTCPCCRKNVS
jgi:hypothetical protein